MRPQLMSVLAVQVMIVVAALVLLVAADDRWPAYIVLVAVTTLNLFIMVYERWRRRS